MYNEDLARSNDIIDVGMWQSLLEDYDLFEQLMPFKLNIEVVEFEVYAQYKSLGVFMNVYGSSDRNNYEDIHINKDEYNKK
ncbi:hypothetical protein FWK35_00017145 [Aphis craccivora]|uniref:Uncharacterized protein n=1 Tax=Aphis craccivora TaxID=307492 RepID=A0A6G0YQ89_APHCR|nr:hypothetical protein FWK35_00017145 [Aphis craccivora]